MFRINGKLMLRDVVIGNIKDNEVEVINEQLSPLYFNTHKDIESWLKMRAIDSHRTHSRLLKKALRISTTDDLEAVLKFNAATITDNYWVKLDNEDLTWNDIIFKENKFSEVALEGSFEYMFQEPSRTPELTNIGSFEKCWKQDKDGAWWLYKDGTKEENFSELFVNKLGNKLGFDMAVYEYDKGYIKSKDFTNSGEFTLELMRTIISDNDDYSENFELLYSINEEIAKDYIKMLYLDTLCFNVDRHTENYGLLRNSYTGEILKLAPNFDNNLSLISRNAKDISPGFVGYFTDFINANTKAKDIFTKLNVTKVTEKDISKIVSTIPIEIGNNIENVKNIVLHSQEIIESKIDIKNKESLLEKEEDKGQAEEKER